MTLAHDIACVSTDRLAADSLDLARSLDVVTGEVWRWGERTLLAVVIATPLAVAVPIAAGLFVGERESIDHFPLLLLAFLSIALGPAIYPAYRFFLAGRGCDRFTRECRARTAEMKRRREAKPQTQK